jgi:PAT family beta-lactamase induction signal transducer AmpG
MFVITYFFLLGIVSGLPLALTSSTLGYMLLDYGIKKETIGMLGIIGSFYSFKFLWAPFVDSISIYRLTKSVGVKKAWMIITSILIGLCMIAISRVSIEHLNIIIILTIVLAFFSTVFDISFDGHRIESISKQDQGNATSFTVYGYRCGMLISGGGALALSHFFGWQNTYIALGIGYITISLVVILIVGRFDKKQHKKEVIKANKDIIKSYTAGFIDILKQKNAILFFLVVITFKLSDTFIGAMTSSFLYEVGFTKLQIAEIVKLYGFWATMIGIGVGGFIWKTIPERMSVIIATSVAMISNLFFIFINNAGADTSVLTIVMCIENFSGGIGTAVLVAMISSYCNKNFAATQYALLTAFASLARNVISTSSGYIATRLGWEDFFIFSAFLEIPCIIMCIVLYNRASRN